MKKSMPLLLLLITLITGCAAIRENVVIEEPVDGPTARVRLVLPKQVMTAITTRGYPNRACIDDKAPGNGTVIGAVVGFQRHLNGQRLGMPPSAASTAEGMITSEIRAVANQPIAFSYAVPSMTSPDIPLGPTRSTTYRVYPGCSVYVSFIPDPGADYELFFKGCSYTAKKLVTTVADGKSTVAEIPFEAESVGPCGKRNHRR